jgi:hypothetical protein
VTAFAFAFFAVTESFLFYSLSSFAISFDFMATVSFLGRSRGRCFFFQRNNSDLRGIGINKCVVDITVIGFEGLIGEEV